MKIEHESGRDVVEFEYYAEAEPKLLEIQKQYDFGSMSEAEAHEQIVSLVGPHRFNEEWSRVARAGHPPKGRDRGLWELEQFEAAHPPEDLRRRIYGVACAENIETLLGFQGKHERGPRSYV